MVSATTNRTAKGIFFALGVAALGACSPDSTGGNSGISASEEPIIGGTAVTTDTIGTPNLGRTTDGAICSSVLLSDGWLLTARHCLNIDGSGTSTTPVKPSTIRISAPNSTNFVTGFRSHLHPTLDVGLLEFVGPLLDSNGRPWSNPLYLGLSSGLVGQTLYCQGWGLGVCNNPMTIGFRSANLVPTASTSIGFDVTTTNGAPNVGKGDSGSPCLTFLNGHWNVAGIASTANQQTCSFSSYVGTDHFRDWAEGVMGNAATLFVNSNYTGVADGLVPGGPTFAYQGLPSYDFGQLKAPGLTGSVMVPSRWSLYLFDSPGFRDTPAFFTSSSSNIGGFGTGSAAIVGRLNLFDTSAQQNFTSVTTGGQFQLGGFDNVVSALTVPAGWTATLYENADYSGTSATFTEGNYSTVGSFFDNKASSMVVQEPAALYVGPNYNASIPISTPNTFSRLQPGCYDMAQMGVPNDSVRSVFVPSGLSVALFRDSGFGPPMTFLTSSAGTLANGWDAQASSVCVFAQPAGCTNLPGSPNGSTLHGLMRPGEALLQGQSLTACGGVYTLAMQWNGQLALWHNGLTQPIWTASGTGVLAAMQNDGNFVLYDSNYHATFSTGTWGRPGAYLAVQTDGNLVVYSNYPNAPWASGTNGR
jgi:hypothetical protein